VVPPTVQVTTTYPGANAAAIARTVALPIEQQVNGVSGMLYMQSYSTDSGTYALTVTFKIGTDIDQAQVLVQNRVSSALASLPDSVQTQGVKVDKRSTAILGFAALTSPDRSRDSLFLSNYATINLVSELSRLPGVGNVTVFGAGQYAMRVWMDPQQLRVRNLTAGDVVGALQQQSQVVPMGQLGAPPAPKGQAFQQTLEVRSSRFNDPAEFGDIVIKSAPSGGGQIVRLKDVARVELGAQTYSQDFKLDGAPAAGIAIAQDPTANALDVMNVVKARMAELSKTFPPGVSYQIPFDTTRFVDAAIHEVYKTLIETGVLVLAVILLFLGDWRAMMVPATTVPVTVIGAFGVMAALGFTVNMSTLFALVLAIGIVVDDAIVVVEGAAHGIERGLSPHDAAGSAMDKLLGPIIGITLVLVSVFTPAAFLPGLTGQMFAQFALVIAATALISAVNAVTLKPTQCATWLRPHDPSARPGWFRRGFDRAYGAVERRYAALVAVLVRRSVFTAVLGVAVVALSVFGLTRLPTGFLPLEDQGYFLASVQLPSGASLERTDAALDRIAELLRKVSGVDRTLSIAGVSATDGNAALANSGAIYVVLKDWSERGKSENLLNMYGALNKAVADVDDAKVLVIPPPAIQGIGNSGGFTMQVELRDNTLDWQRLAQVTDAVLRGAQGQSGVQRSVSSFRADAPQIALTVDRIKAATLQVSVDDVFSTLSASLGSSFAGRFDRFGRTFQVFATNEGGARTDLQQVFDLTVRNAQGNMVPLGSLLSVTRSSGPSLVSLYNLYPSASVLGAAAPGFSSGDVLDIMDAVAARTLPPGTGHEWTAMSYQEKAVSGQIYLALGLALLLVYLVLAAQYESWWAPISILLAVPLALVGPVLTFSALGVSINLYTQIGLILLVALSAKNAILIVEYARKRREDGESLVDAAVAAARDRFRPILMTSIAFAAGVVPLILATGAGANAQRSIGITTFTGMLSSTLLVVVLTPASYAAIRRFEEWLASVRGSKAIRVAGEARKT
jgi:HAE1 family hydrophobic/amphiphilic exporter-1